MGFGLSRRQVATVGSRISPTDLQRFARSAVVHLVVAAGSVLFLIPLVWMATTSFKTMQQAFIFPPQWIPNPLVVTPYVKGWTSYPFPLFYRNTLVITTLAVIGVVCSS